jgi:rhamnosyltransferase
MEPTSIIERVAASERASAARSAADVPGKRVCAVVVTYHPDHEVLLRLLRATALQVGRIVIVDNGSSGDVGQLLKAVDSGGVVELLPLGGNYGLGTAHNAGIEFARKNKFEYVLILDQDSVPRPGMIASLLRTMEAQHDSGVRVAAVGPKYVDPETRRESYFVQYENWRIRRIHCPKGGRGEQVIAVDFLISSGSLIPLHVLDDVGGMDETLFIDHVDTDWYLRAKSRGYTTLGVCGAEMEHSLGAYSIPVRLLREHMVPVHSPLRLYYIMRNSIILYRKPYAPTRWVLNDTKRIAAMFLFFSMVAPPRLKNMRMMLKGLWDGLRGISGTYQTSQEIH